MSGKVYNVGTGSSVTLLDLVAALNRVLGKSIVAAHGPARVGDIRDSRAKIGRIRAELGYEPSVAFEEGCSERWGSELGWKWSFWTALALGFDENELKRARNSRNWTKWHRNRPLTTLNRVFPRIAFLTPPLHPPILHRLESAPEIPLFC